MGAYENPVIPVDTQSGQYYRELQNTIATSFEGVAKGYSDRAEKTRTEYNKRKAEIEENIRKSQEYGFELYTDIAKNTAGDATVDWNKAYEPLIQKAVKYRSDLLNGFSKDSQADLKGIANIKSSVDNVVTSIADLSAAGKPFLAGKLIGVGVPNGLSAHNQVKTLAAMEVLTNPQANGKVELVFKDDNPLNAVWVIKDKEGVILQEIGTKQLKDLSNPNGTGLIQIVKDPVKQYNETVLPLASHVFNGEQTKGKDGTTTFVPSGTIKETKLIGPVLEKPAPGTKKIVNGKEVSTEKIEYRAVDIKAIRSDEILTKSLNGVADGNLVNPLDAFNQYTEVFSKSVPTNPNMTKDFILTDQGKEEYRTAFKEYFYKTQIPPTQDLRKVPADIATVEYSLEKNKTAITKQKSVSSQLSAAERKDRAAAWQRNKEAVAKLKESNLSKPIVGPADPNERMVWDSKIKVTSGEGGAAKMGAWVKQNKDKKTGAWFRDVDTYPIRSRNEAAQTFLQGLNLNAPTIEDYFSEYDVNARPGLE